MVGLYRQWHKSGNFYRFFAYISRQYGASRGFSTIAKLLVEQTIITLSTAIVYFNIDLCRGGYVFVAVRVSVYLCVRVQNI